MKNHLKSIVLVFILILGLCVTFVARAAKTDEINDTVIVGTKILAKDGPDVSVVIPEPPEVAPSKVLTVTVNNIDGSSTSTSSYKTSDGTTVAISRTKNADGTVNESISTNDGKTIESRGVVLDGTEKPGDTPNYASQINFSGTTTQNPTTGGSATTGVVTNGYGVPQYLQTIATQKNPDKNDPNSTLVTTIVSRVSLDGSTALRTTIQETHYTIVNGRMVALTYTTAWTGIGDKALDTELNRGIGVGSVAVASNNSKASPYSEPIKVFSQIIGESLESTDTGKATAGADLVKTVEDWCETNPDDISCTGVKSFCDIHPSDPICVGVPDYCELHPADVICTGVKTFCETYPSNPACNSNPTFCESHPSDPSCNIVSFCVANPSDPSCGGSSVCSILSAEITPNNKMVYVGSKLSLNWDSNGCDSCVLSCTDSSKCGIDTTQNYATSGHVEAKPQAGYYAYKITCTGPGLNNVSEKVLTNGAYTECNTSQPDNCLRIRRPFIFETPAFINALLGKN